jgi:uncharacterized membrane protein
MNDDYQPANLPHAHRDAVPSTGRQSLTVSSMLLPALFLFLVLPLSLVCAVITPPGQVADEPAHIGKAESLLHGELLGRRGAVEVDGNQTVLSGVDVDVAPMLAAITLAVHPPRPDRSLFEKAQGIAWTDKTVFVSIGPIASYFPAFYLPGAVAMGVSKAMGATPLGAILAGRVVNALCFGLLGMAALLVARRGRTVLFCTLAVPMSLSLGASFNQDGLIIAAGALAAGLMTRRGDPASPARRSWWMGYGLAAVLVTLICLSKPPYLPMAMLLLLPLPPARLWRQARPELLLRVAVLVAVGLVVVAWAGLSIVHVTTPVPQAPYAPGPLWPGDPQQTFSQTDVNAQLQVLLANPLRLVTLPVMTLLHDINMIHMMIGVLGWLDVILPPWVYRAWVWAAVGALLADAIRERRPGLPAWLPPPRAWDTILLLLGIFGSFVGIYLSQYLIWTHVGLTRIDGPQGRYLLPLVPLAALAVPRVRMAGGTVLRGLFATLPVLMAAVDVVVVPLTLVGAYRP